MLKRMLFIIVMIGLHIILYPVCVWAICYYLKTGELLDNKTTQWHDNIILKLMKFFG